MKNYNLISPQEKNFCLVSCVQGILRHHGIEISQKDISLRLTKSEKGYLVHDKRIYEFFQSQGLSYQHYWQNQIPLGEPEILFEEELDILIGLNSHTSLFEEFSKGNVYLRNPNNGFVYEKKLIELEKEMKNSEDGFYGVVKIDDKVNICL